MAVVVGRLLGRIGRRNVAGRLAESIADLRIKRGAWALLLAKLIHQRGKLAGVWRAETGSPARQACGGLEDRNWLTSEASMWRAGG